MHGTGQQGERVIQRKVKNTRFINSSEICSVWKKSLRQTSKQATEFASIYSVVDPALVETIQ